MHSFVSGLVLAVVRLGAQDPVVPNEEVLRDVERAELSIPKGDLPTARDAIRRAWQIASEWEPQKDASGLEQRMLQYRIALSASDANDFRTAHAAWEVVAPAFLEGGDEETKVHRFVLGKWGLARRNVGDWKGAKSVQERLLAIESRISPEDAAGLQNARLNLATTMHWCPCLKSKRPRAHGPTS